MAKTGFDLVILGGRVMDRDEIGTVAAPGMPMVHVNEPLVRLAVAAS